MTAQHGKIVWLDKVRITITASIIQAREPDIHKDMHVHTRIYDIIKYDFDLYKPLMGPHVLREAIMELSCSIVFRP